MNTTFNIARFNKWFSNEWQINLKKIMFFWGGLLGIAVIYFGFWSSMSEKAGIISATLPIFFMIILGFQGIITSIFFNEFSSKTKTQSLLLIPATQTEKFTAKFINCMIIYPLLSSLYLYLVLHANLAYNHWIEESMGVASSQDYDKHMLTTFFHNHDLLLVLASFQFFIGSAFLLGAQTFKKLAAVKTGLSGIAIFFALIPVAGFIYFIVSGNWPNTCIPFLQISEKGLRGYSFMDSFSKFFGTFMFLGLYLIAVSRIKFNEKTV